MLRIRKNKWGFWVFDAWLVLFTAAVVYGFVVQRHTSSTNRRLIKENAAIEHRFARLSKERDRQICVRVNNLNAVIVKTLQRSKMNLPRLQYYKEHPHDLKLAIQEINHEIIVFTPRQCTRKEVK